MTDTVFKKSIKCCTALLLAFAFSLVFLIATHADDNSSSTTPDSASSQSEGETGATGEENTDSITETVTLPSSTSPSTVTTASGRPQRSTTVRPTHTNPFRGTTSATRRGESDTGTTAESTTATTAARTTTRRATGTGVPNEYNRTTYYSGVPATSADSGFTTAYAEVITTGFTDPNAYTDGDGGNTGFTWEYTSEYFESPEFTEQNSETQEQEEAPFKYRKWVILLIAVAAAAIIAGAVISLKYFKGAKSAGDDGNVVNFEGK